jgi:molybdopterin converting factor small subunit
MKQTMRLRVQYTAQLRAAVGRAEEEVELPEGSSLAELLLHLASELCREAAPFLLTPSGDLQPSLLVAVNKGAVSPRDARAVRISTGDVVTLLPAIAGG